MVTKQSRRDCQEDLEAQAAEPLSFMPNLPAQGKGKRDREAFQAGGGASRHMPKRQCAGQRMAAAREHLEGSAQPEKDARRARTANNTKAQRKSRDRKKQRTEAMEQQLQRVLQQLEVERRQRRELERFVTGQFQYRLKAEQAGVDCGLIDRMNTSASDFARMPLPAYQPPASFQPVQEAMGVRVVPNQEPEQHLGDDDGNSAEELQAAAEAAAQAPRPRQRKAAASRRKQPGPSAAPRQQQRRQQQPPPVQSGTAACGMPSPERPRRACAGQPAEGVTYPGALIELPGPRPSSSGSTGTAAELATAVQAFLCGDPVGKAVSALHPDDAAFF